MQQRNGEQYRISINLSEALSLWPSLINTAIQVLEHKSILLYTVLRILPNFLLRQL